MAIVNVLTDEFAEAAAAAGRLARRTALAFGHSVVFVDDSGRYVEEFPDGTRLHVHLQPGEPREIHLRVLGEISDL